MLGEFDHYEKRRDTWNGLALVHKAFVRIRGASHFAQYERGRHVVHRFAGEWLRGGSVGGATQGEFNADWDGKLLPLGSGERIKQ